MQATPASSAILAMGDFVVYHECGSVFLTTRNQLNFKKISLFLEKNKNILVNFGRNGKMGFLFC